MLILIHTLPGDGTATVVFSFVERDLMRWCGYYNTCLDYIENNVSCCCLSLLPSLVLVKTLYQYSIVRLFPCFVFNRCAPLLRYYFIIYVLVSQLARIRQRLHNSKKRIVIY
jgi:hypothetical protein